jgi:hypothetical protein
MVSATLAGVRGRVYHAVPGGALCAVIPRFQAAGGHTVKDVLLTPEGYEKLKQEIEHLRGDKRREVADRIRVARETTSPEAITGTPTSETSSAVSE